VKNEAQKHHQFLFSEWRGEVDFIPLHPTLSM